MTIEALFISVTAGPVALGGIVSRTGTADRD